MRYTTFLLYYNIYSFNLALAHLKVMVTIKYIRDYLYVYSPISSVATKDKKSVAMYDFLNLIVYLMSSLKRMVLELRSSGRLILRSIRYFLLLFRYFLFFLSLSLSLYIYIYGGDVMPHKTAQNLTNLRVPLSLYI